MNAHTCPIHGDEHWEETELTTATYSYCTRCSDVTTGRNMAAIRDELEAKGYRLGHPHADPERVWTKEQRRTA